MAAGLLDFLQTPAGVAALGATVGSGGAAAPFVLAPFAAQAAVETPEAVQQYLENPTPENLQQALLTPGFAALLTAGVARPVPKPPFGAVLEAPARGPEIIPPSRRLPAPREPIITPAPADTSFVRGVPAEPPVRVVRGLLPPPARPEPIPVQAARLPEATLERGLEATRGASLEEVAAAQGQPLEAAQVRQPVSLHPRSERVRRAEAQRLERQFVEGITESQQATPETVLAEVLEEGAARLRALREGRPAEEVRQAGAETEFLRAPRGPARPPAEERTLPGLERALEEQRAGEARVTGERLTEAFEQPLEQRGVLPAETAPIFRGTEAAPQREIFEPSQAPKLERLVDEFGDAIRPGGNAVDSLGRRLKVRAIIPAEDVPARFAELQPSLREGYVEATLPNGKSERIPIGDVTAKRHGRPEALKGIGGRKAQAFGREGGGEVGLSEQEAARKLMTRGGGEGEGGFFANPVFSGRFWEQADAALRPLTQKIDQAIEKRVGRLPVSVRRWLREEPRTKRVIQEARREVGVRTSETEAVLRMVMRENPTPDELVIADRLARGVPADLSAARPEIRPVLERAAEHVHGLAQQMTTERAALGLPVREEWVNAPRWWYPNLWKQHLLGPHMVAGRLFSLFRGKLRPPGPAERGSLKPRTTDRWTVVDEKGNLAHTKGGQSTIFRTPEDARAYVESHPRRHLRIVEPMTHEQTVGHGLIEDLATNLRRGFGKEWSLVAKTRALETIGKEFARETPEPGYVNLGEMGYQIPAELAKRNPNIARLRDGYVPREVAETLTAYYGKQGFFPSWLRALEGSLRKWVTIRSPFRHPRQLMENHLTLSFADPKAAINVPGQVRSFRDFARGVRGEEGVPYFEEYRGSEIWWSDIVRGEFETVWKGIDQAPTKDLPLSLAERMALWAETNPTARRLMETDRFAEKLYRGEDQAYKYFFYRTLRERGFSPEQAEQRVLNSFFRYDDLPPIVRSANRWIPFAPTVTWNFARILGTALRDRPATTTLKLGLLLYGYAFTRDQFMQAAGITEQDEKNMGELAPKLWEIPLPMTDAKGRNMKVSLLWLLPFGEVFFLSDLLREEDTERGLVATARKFMPMALQPLATVVSGRGPFGEKVLRGTEEKGEAARKLTWAVIRGWLPGLLGQYWERLYKNATAGEERKKPLLEKALVEPITGRIEHFRPAEQVGLRKALTAGRAREVQEEAYRQRGRFVRGTTTAESYREEVGKLRERTAGEELAHPETLAVVQALEQGRHEDARAAYRRLKQSGFYATKQEALDAVRDLLRRRGRLTEMAEGSLPQAREAAQAVVDQFRQTGRVSRASRQRLTQALESLPESDQNAILDWLEQQMRIHRQQKPAPATERRTPPPGV